jgi:hypothetical protein
MTGRRTSGLAWRIVLAGHSRLRAGIRDRSVPLSGRSARGVFIVCQGELGSALGPWGFL